ncbi:hypothetical protein EDD18DRAFT_1391277 [Armillaria luteobubalina]|uniref:Uncharacterized protein n=1 Tax=Armillaria luteobubalina TaxID=153913 RepID=A0AA39NZE9_9AGAR|nr:hypothetical protein EDD18DRAFT_1391277 [Armillaria luteobubalina]
MRLDFHTRASLAYPHTTTMSAATSTQKTIVNEEHQVLICFTEVEIITIAVTGKLEVWLKITSGKNEYKTKAIKISKKGVPVVPECVVPKWTINMKLDFDPQAKVLWELYGHLWMILRSKVLGSIEKTLRELFEENDETSADIHLYDGSSEVTILRVPLKLDSPGNVMMALVPTIEKPLESSKFLDPSTLQTVFEATKTMINTLMGAHPAATITWGFLSIGFEVGVNGIPNAQYIQVIEAGPGESV